MDQANAKKYLLSLFDSAWQACLPKNLVSQAVKNLSFANCKRVVVIGAGKAAGAMAAAIEQHWQPSFPPLSGLMVTTAPNPFRCQKIEILTAGHPVPNQKSVHAAIAMKKLVSNLRETDYVLAFFSGGGSALLAMPVEGLSLEQKQAITDQLLSCGASISEINCIRKGLSQIKGGKLALLRGLGPLTTWVISDIPGDDLSMVASGPTFFDQSTTKQAVDIVQKYNIALPKQVWQKLQQGLWGLPTSKKSVFSQHQQHLLANSLVALQRAAKKSVEYKIPAFVLSDEMQGESRMLAKTLGAIAKNIAKHQMPVPSPCVLLCGGETTVTLPKKVTGKGGRNVDFLLALAQETQGYSNIFALAADTDGIDGTDAIAGAVLFPDSVQRNLGQGYPLSEALENFDGHGYFQKLGDSVITGPTYTNVNDFRAIAVL